MNILFISAIFPYPLYSGGQVRIFNLLKELSKHHSITLCSFIREEKERTYEKELPFLTSVRFAHRGKAFQLPYLFRSLTSSYPWLLATYENASMEKIISEELEKGKYDCIHIEPFYVWPSLPKTKIPIVVGEHNIEYNVYKDYVKRFWFFPAKPSMNHDVSKMKHWEEYAWDHSKSVVTVSCEDALVVEKRIPTNRVFVVPNGVDVNHFHFSIPTCDPKKLNFLFIGNFLWLPNKEAVRILINTIWPKVLEKYPNGTLSIVGKHMPDEILKQQKNNIVCKTDVSDIREALSKADMLLAPMTIGGGTKFKILEAMAAGVPVITTKEGAEGLAVTSGIHMKITTINDFPNSISSLIENKKQFETLAKNGRKLVETVYNWESIAKKLSDVWKKSI